MSETLNFRKYDGTPILDAGVYVADWVSRHPHCTVTIGCDSQEYARFIKYAIVIVLHDVDESGIGHGAHVISAVVLDHSRNMKSDIYTKLWKEAELAIEAAKLIDACGKSIKIHLDYNSKESEYSNVLYNTGIGFFKAMGYDVCGKPYSYCASHTADHYVR
jgi:predicted RNase H-related nuclease YkuK (DUF458 family)